MQLALKVRPLSLPQLCYPCARLFRVPEVHRTAADNSFHLQPWRVEASTDEVSVVSAQLQSNEWCYALVQAVSFALLAAAALLPVFRPGKVPATVSIATVVLSMVFAGAAAWFQRFLDRTYHFQDYVHALVD